MKMKQDVIIIGSGIGGLSAGAYLSKNGYKVKIYERLNHPGGYVHTFTRKGYRFEASTHQVCGFNRFYLYSTLKLLGIKDKIDIHLSDNAYEAITYEDNDLKDRYFIKAGYKEAYKSLCSYLPGSRQEIKKMLTIVKGISHDLLRIKKLKRKLTIFQLYDLITVLWMSNAKRGSVLNKIGINSYKYLVKYRDLTFDKVLNEIENTDLKYIISQHCYYTGLGRDKVSGLILSIVFYLYTLNRPGTFKGGSDSLIKALITIINNNGEIIYNSMVRNIIVKDGNAVGVKLTNGEEHYAKYIISNSTAYDTYTNMIHNKSVFDKDFLKKINNYRPGYSIFQIYLGLPYNINEYGFNADTSFFTNEEHKDVLLVEKLSPGEISPFLITNYGNTNPEFNKGNKTSIVIGEFDYINRWNNLSDAEYKKQKEQTQDLILKKIKKITKLPLEKADVCFSATPKTMAYYSGDKFGAMIGAELNIDQSANSRFDYASPVKNLFLAGADTKPAGGIAASLDSGLMAGNYIIKK